MRLLKAATLYVALVFAAGFILGPLRILWIVPRVGERAAELMEAPIMLSVILLAARWVTRRMGVTPTPSRLLAVGSIALGFLVGLEFTVVLWLRGMRVGEYLASRDPVAGAVYGVMLGVFAIMPLLVARRERQ